MAKYPDGVCKYCGKRFERPYKFRTEIEASHEHGCHLEEIERTINDKEFDFNDIMRYQGELDYISKVASLGARQGNIYWDRMMKCRELEEKMFKKKVKK